MGDPGGIELVGALIVEPTVGFEVDCAVDVEVWLSAGKLDVDGTVATLCDAEADAIVDVVDSASKMH